MRVHRPFAAAVLAALLGLQAPAARADSVALSDDELSDVAGKGVAILVDLQLNAGLLTGQNIDSRITAGFTVDGITTYAIAQNFGGILDMFAITLDPSVNATGLNYLAIGMPYYLAAKQFGVRALAVQADPTGPVTSSLGSILLNGSANMTGQLNVWPK
jgi:hypothetical protein